MTNTVVWSRDMCPYCDQAKALLKSSGIEFEERNLSTDEWTKEQLLEAVPNARTVPQIFLNGEYVGGYDDLQQHFKDNKKITGDDLF